MPADSIVAFWAVALLLIMVPGADWAFVLGVSLRGRSVLPAVGGLVLGYTGITIAVAVGVGAVVGRSPALLGGLPGVGGCYLIWHAATPCASPAAAATRRSATPGPAVPGPAAPGPAAPGPTAAGPVAAGAPPADTRRAGRVRRLGGSG